jgi:imidazolonepropionase-like amidohydrolase
MICGGRFGSVALILAALALPLGQASGKKKPLPIAKVPSPFTLDAYPSTYRPLPRIDTLIAGATVLDGAGARLDNADVLMRDGKIVAIGPKLDRSGVSVIEARGRWVTPGIIDVHSHDGTYSLPLTSIDEKASDVSELSDPNVADTWIEHAVNVQDPSFARALAGGVTTLQILPGSSPLFGGRSVVLKTIAATTVQAMKFPGAPSGLKMACGENPKLEFGSKGRSPTSRQGELAAMRGAFLKAQQYRRAWKKYEDGDEDDEPDRDLKLDTLVGVLNGDLRVHIHCYRSDEMATMISLAHEFGFRIAAFHHAAEAYKIPGLLRENGICAAVWADWWGFKMEAIDAIRENAAFVDAGGGCAMMHSDSPHIGQWLTIEAAKAAAGRRAGLSLPPEQIIRWITSNPARALGLEDRIGTLAPGRNADVVIWSGDPFSIYSHADQVFIDGALAYDRSDPRHQPRSDFELGRPEAVR